MCFRKSFYSKRGERDFVKQPVSLEEADIEYSNRVTPASMYASPVGAQYNESIATSYSCLYEGGHLYTDSNSQGTYFLNRTQWVRVIDNKEKYALEKD